MDIRLHTGKAVTQLSKVLKANTSPTASKVLMVDLSKFNTRTRTRIFEAAMQAIVATILRTQIADFPAQGPLPQTRIILPLPPGGEVGTFKTSSGLQVMQALTIGALVSIPSNRLQAICKLLLMRKQLQSNRVTMIIHFGLRRTCRLRIRAKKNQKCRLLQDRNPSLRRNRNPSSASLSKPNL